MYSWSFQQRPVASAGATTHLSYQLLRPQFHCVLTRHRSIATGGNCNPTWSLRMWWRITGLFFTSMRYWSRFTKFCFLGLEILLPLEKLSLSFMTIRKTHVFIILVFRSFPVTSPFGSSSQCRRPNRWESQQPITFRFFRFCKEKIAFLNSRLAAFTVLRPPPPPPRRPRFRLSSRFSETRTTTLPSNGHENAAFSGLFHGVGARS